MFSFFFNDTATTEIYTLSLHDALPIFIEEGNIDLNEYGRLLKDNDFYQIENVNGHYFSRFPIGASILALPLVFAFKLFSNLDETIRFEIPKYIEAYISSIFVAVTAVFIFLIARLSIKKDLYAALPALVFAFCTSAWSIAGLALWQHSPSMLMLTVALYLILLADRRPGIVQYASIPLAFSYAVRPTNSISIILLTLFILMRYRSYIIRYFAWGLLVAVPFIIFNLQVYGALLSPYYQPGRLASNKYFLEALAGNLVSPSRGLFVFSPVLLLAFLGVWLKIRDRQFERLDLFIAAIIVIHWITVSSFEPWWAGYTFGPRFFTDMLPYFIYFTIPVFAFITVKKSPWRPAVITGLVVLSLLSLFIQHRGATCEQVQEWNSHPQLNENQERLWDWGEISFLSGIDHNLFNCRPDWHDP